ncbi:uncharacterized protein LOC112458638 [Temnothorax curvispinosus]|uniref:Uncharacterized protein LOC112458638 n=1 Tax=Temnothorax curvispinosus TaxID=300111 RepID=A0A6J1QBJ1_9HYME|nr:uncharacterized protein LOC112458638 [Temnothorax curvispinosus]
MNFINQAFILNELEAAEFAADRNPRIIYEERDPFQLSEKKFVKIYRLSKRLATEFIEDVQPFIIQGTRVSALSTNRKVLTALRYFASGSYQLHIGQNLNSAVSQSSVSRSIHEIINAANRPEVMDKWIKFPRTVVELHHLRNEYVLYNSY